MSAPMINMRTITHVYCRKGLLGECAVAHTKGCYCLKNWSRGKPHVAWWTPCCLCGTVTPSAETADPVLTSEERPADREAACGLGLRCRGWTPADTTQSPPGWGSELSRWPPS